MNIKLQYSIILLLISSSFTLISEFHRYTGNVWHVLSLSVLTLIFTNFIDLFSKTNFPTFCFTDFSTAFIFYFLLFLISFLLALSLSCFFPDQSGSLDYWSEIFMSAGCSYYYTFPSQYCFNCVLHILISGNFIFICFGSFETFLAHGLLRTMLFTF